MAWPTACQGRAPRFHHITRSVAWPRRLQCLSGWLFARHVPQGDEHSNIDKVAFRKIMDRADLKQTTKPLFSVNYSMMALCVIHRKEVRDCKKWP